MCWDELKQWAIDPIDMSEAPLRMDWREILNHLLEKPSEPVRKHIAADWFDDQNLSSIATALRWCGRKRKFPYSARSMSFAMYAARFEIAFAHRPSRIQQFRQQTRGFYHDQEKVWTKWSFYHGSPNSADRLDWSPFRYLRRGVIRVIPVDPTRSSIYGFRMYKVMEEQNASDTILVPTLQALIDLGEALESAEETIATL